MQQWTNENAGPVQLNRFKKAWSHLDTEHYRMIELRGIVGEDEYRSELICFSIGGSNARREAVTKLQEQIGNDHNWTLTKQNAAIVVKLIEAATEEARKNPPVIDKRKTREQVDAENAESARLDAQWKQKAEAEQKVFLDLYSTGDTATVLSGQMVMVAQLCYDNSDPMSDYFDSHATLGPAFALLVVHEQAKTQALARAAAARSPLLKDVEFTWHTENYSMGHGNYLQSKGFELPEQLKGIRKAYRGADVTHAHWEIKFSGKGEYPTFQGYGEMLTVTMAPASASASTGGITVRENAALGGIELHFSSKPDDATVSKLKAHGWRWKRGTNYWYKKASDSVRAFANEMAGVETVAA
jgi:hypothetical protein